MANYNRGFFSNPNSNNNNNNSDYQVKQKQSSYSPTYTSQGSKSGGRSADFGGGVQTTSTTTSTTTKKVTTTTTTVAPVYSSVLFLGNTASNYTYFIYGGDGVQTTTFDTGVSTSAYGNYNIYTIQDSGYMFVFNGSGVDILQFVDAHGNLIQQVTVSNNNSNYNTLQCVYNYYYYTDGSDIVLYYFDGINVYSYRFTGANSLSLGSYYNDMMDKGFILSATVGSTTTWYCADGLGNINQLFVEETGYSYYPETYNKGGGIYNENEKGNFIVSVVYNNNTQYYDRVDIFSKTGSILQSVSLSSLNINDHNDYFFSQNYFSSLLRISNGGYYIIYYNGNQNRLLTKTIDSIYDNYDWTGVDGVQTYIFYQNSASHNNGFYYSDYLSYLSIYPDDTSISDLTTLNNGTANIGIYFSGETTNDYCSLTLDEEGYLHHLNISKSGNTDIPTNVLVSDISYIEYWYITKVIAEAIYTGTASTYITYGVTGSIINSEVVSSNSGAVLYGYGDMVFSVFDNNDHVRYYSNTGNNYQLTRLNQSYNNIRTFNYDNYYFVGELLLWDSNSYNARFLDTSNLYDNIDMSFLSGSVYSDIELCEDFINVVYIDSGHNSYIRVYDTNGSIIQSISVGQFSSGGLDWSSRNLAVYHFYDGINNYYYLVSKNSYVTTIDPADYFINNYYWWDY